MPRNFKQAIPMLLGFCNGGSVGFFSVLGVGGAGRAEEELVGGLSSGRAIGVHDTGFGQMMCFGPVYRYETGGALGGWENVEDGAGDELGEVTGETLRLDLVRGRALRRLQWPSSERLSGLTLKKSYERAEWMRIFGQEGTRRGW